MKEEMFDVVNNVDEVIATATRSEVHLGNLYHRAVHVVIYDDIGRVLVQKRSLTKDCSPGLWDTSAGGHVASGEDYDSAAIRELKEELGLESDLPLKFLCKLDANELTGHEFVGVYEGKTTQVPILQASELVAARWVSIDELNRWIARDSSQFTKVFLKICQEVGLITA